MGLFSQLGKSGAGKTQADVVAGENGVVRNLAITGAKMTAYQRSGVIAGVCFGLVENCYIEAEVTITGTASYQIGGVIAGEMGYQSAADGIGLVRNNVINCKTNSQTGAITGYMKCGGSQDVAEMNANVPTYVVNNYVVIDDMARKALFSLTTITAVGTNVLFEMSGIAGIMFDLDTAIWNITSGSLPTLKK